MSKVLIGIAIAATSLAFAISTSADAATAQTIDIAEQKLHAFNEKSQLLEMDVEIMESDSSTSIRFPLMLPQPTKIEGQNRYDLADSVRRIHG